MRLLPVLLFLPLFAFQVHAQPAPPPGPAAQPAPAATPAAEAPHASHPRTAAKSHRMSWQERFAQANTTNDGHLTLEQAKAGYRTIALHFKQIDADKKGFVTAEDVGNWHKLERAMRHTHPGQTLRPRPAMQQGVMQPHPISTSATETVAPMTPPNSASAANGSATGGQR